MNKILLIVLMGLAMCQSNQKGAITPNSVGVSDSVSNDTSIHFDVSYKIITKNQKFTTKVEPLTDSLEIRYLSKGYNAEYENGGRGFVVLLPKDTTVSIICNTKRFSQKQWKLRNELVQKIKNDMTEIALSEEVEKYFDVFFYYTRQEYLYINGGVVDDYGVEWPDYSCQDNAPIEEYKLEDGKWVLSKYIAQRGMHKTDQDYGLDKANEILKARFGKIAEEMEEK